MSNSWVPAFPGQRPPFPPGNDAGVKLEPGHELSLQHGAYSPRKVDPLARDLVELVLQDPDTAYLKAPSYRAELWAWARAEARVQLLEEYLAQRAGDEAIADPGDPRVASASLELHRASARAASARTRLGLTPLARARLGKDVAQGEVARLDVAQAMAQLAELERQGRLPASLAEGGEGDGAVAG